MRDRYIRCFGDIDVTVISASEIRRLLNRRLQRRVDPRTAALHRVLALQEGLANTTYGLSTDRERHERYVVEQTQKICEKALRGYR